jgi:hypothetical protein
MSGLSPATAGLQFCCPSEWAMRVPCCGVGDSLHALVTCARQLLRRLCATRGRSCQPSALPAHVLGVARRASLHGMVAQARQLQKGQHQETLTSFVPWVLPSQVGHLQTWCKSCSVWLAGGRAVLASVVWSGIACLLGDIGLAVHMHGVKLNN